MRRAAFLTMEDPSGFVIYDQLAIQPLNQRGWDVVEVPWNSPVVDWNDFELVVIRSPWDYQRRCDAFLRVLRSIEQSQARLENNLSIVAWNIEKTYLRELEQRGIAIVPTHWTNALDELLIQELLQQTGAPELICKPIVGANADDTFRLPADSVEEWSIAIRCLHRRPCMVQPFVENILTEGEFSLFYFGHCYSHAVVKTPKAGDFRVQEEHGGCIRSADPDPEIRQAADRVMAALPSSTLYARVDLVRMPDGQPVLMEVELIEPSLYFAFDPESPHRFARAIDRL